MDFAVYNIKSFVDGSFYVGMSERPVKRLQDHNNKMVKSTKSKAPWEIVHLEKIDTRLAARHREKHLKSAAGRKYRKLKLGL
jgi:putative endonuclease